MRTVTPRVQDQTVRGSTTTLLDRRLSKWLLQCRAPGAQSGFKHGGREGGGGHDTDSKVIS
jgi:hypothetical protein